MEENNSDLGPQKISFPAFVLKLLAGGGGGAVGAVILLVIFMLAGTILEPLTNTEALDAGYVSPIFVFIVMIMVFLATTVSNILSVLLLGLTERGKYGKLSTAIYQVFIVSVVIFLLMVPVYFIAASGGVGLAGYAVALHIIISAMISALILEIVSNYKYSLVGVYGVGFSIVISGGVLFALSGIVQSTAILLFIALPVVWGSIAFTLSIVTMLYGWIARTYDKDFLSTETLYGKDYGEPEQTEEEEKPKKKDSAGAEFLRKD